MRSLCLFALFISFSLFASFKQVSDAFNRVEASFNQLSSFYETSYLDDNVVQGSFDKKMISQQKQMIEELKNLLSISETKEAFERGEDSHFNQTILKKLVDEADVGELAESNVSYFTRETISWILSIPLVFAVYNLRNQILFGESMMRNSKDLWIVASISWLIGLLYNCTSQYGDVKEPLKKFHAEYLDALHEFLKLIDIKSLESREIYTP